MNTVDFIKGVNLGGWLVLERWMTPSVFKGTGANDEWAFMSDVADAEAKIYTHRQTFIQESDFAWLQQQGINAVRLPLGYWWNSDDGPYKNCLEQVDWAVEMCEKYKLKLLLDMHGAPGSQNGRDHSGRIGKAHWQREQYLQDKTITSLEALAQRYRSSPAVWGIQLLNEPPVGVFNLKLRAFYKKAERVLREVAPPHWRIVFHDSFTPRLLNGVLPRQAKHKIAMDIHWYHQTFALGSLVPISWYEAIVRYRAKLLPALQKRQEVYIGEFSGALNWKLLQKLSAKERMPHMQQHIKLQLEVYEQANGWFYWSYKTEKTNDIWNFRAQVEAGVFSDALSGRTLEP